MNYEKLVKAALILCCIAGVLALVLPNAIVYKKGTQTIVTLFTGIKDINADVIIKYLPQILSFVLGIILPLIAVFNQAHKTRKILMWLTMPLILCNFLTLYSSYFFTKLFASKTGGAQTIAGIGMYMPIVGLVFLIVALLMIKKEEALVRFGED
jgi:Domain of unknown function (DUF4293)